MAGVAACHPPDAQGQCRLCVTPDGQSVRHRDDNDDRLFPPNLPGFLVSSPRSSPPPPAGKMVL